MKHIDLCSGVGMFALAAWIVWGDEYECLSFVEINTFCQQILRKEFPLAPIHDNLKTFNAKPFNGTTGLLTAGFPCQPHSLAGKRQGAADDRDLWPEVHRAIEESRPTWVLLENVIGLLSTRLEDGSFYIDHIISDMESCGYTVEALDIPAASTNGRHLRYRLWLLAHSSQERQQRQPQSQGAKPYERGRLGDAGEDVGHDGGKRQEQLYATALGGGPTRRPTEAALRSLWQGCDRGSAEKWGAAQPGLVRDADAVARWLDGSAVVAPPCPAQFDYEPPRLASGVPHTRNRIEALGNGIVPMIPIEIFECIKLAEQAHQ